MQKLEMPENKIDFVNEVILQKQKELAELKHQCELTIATIQSQKSKWNSEKAQQAIEMRAEQQEFKRNYNKEMDKVDEMKRVSTLILQRTKAQETEVHKRLLAITEREAIIANLNQERLEIRKLRQDAERKMFDADKKLSQAHDNYNQGQHLMANAQKVLEDCDRRNKAMDDSWNKMQKWQEELTLKQKNYEILKKEVDSKLSKEEKNA